MTPVSYRKPCAGDSHVWLEEDSALEESRWKVQLHECKYAKFLWLISMFMSLSVFALTENVNGIRWTYNVVDNCACLGAITDYGRFPAVPTSTSGTIVIPSTLGGCPVTGIGYLAFDNCSQLTSVTIPDSVTSIAEDAFHGCSGLKHVKIGNGVTNIYYSSFLDCNRLKSVTVPQYVLNCGLRNVFSAAYSSLTDVSFSSVVTNIDAYAFSGCSSLTSVTIPDSVSRIGENAFYGCNRLRNVTIPQYVCLCRMSSIFPSAYNSITNIVIMDGVTTISKYAFNSCRQLVSVTIPNSVKRIEGDLFEGAFSGCSNLKNVYINDLVNWCGISFGGGGTSSNPIYSHPCLYAKKIFLNGIQLVDLVIPNSVTQIKPYVFYLCDGLTSVAIPNSVTNIGEGAFYGCSQLKSMMIPDSVTSIGMKAFDGCSGLTSVTIPSSVTHVGAFAFSYCNGLTNVTIPNSVTSLGSYAFSSCTNLTNLVIGNGITRIGDGAFYGCNGLTSVTISDGVTSIGDYAFSHCSGLTSMTIPCSVTNIDNYAFNECGSLADIYFSGDAPLVGTSTFSSTASSCEAFVNRDSIGWGVAIPGKWNGIAITYSDCMVVFDANGGHGGVSNILNFGEAISVPSVSREGYTFNGWIPDVATIAPSNDVTYTAQWKPIRYIVIFDANGGIGGTSTRQDYGTAIVPPTVTRTGYTFKGWSPSVAATVPANDVTYTAQWQINQYTVSFNANGGTGGTSCKQDYGTAIVAPTVTRTGYTFNGWSPSVAATVPANDVTYTAQWEINQYTVLFDENGGTGGTSAKQNYGTAIVAPTVARTGYTFKGWSPSVAATVPANDVTYIAQWEINQYNVIFDANGGVGGTNTRQDYGTAIAAPTVTRTGYTFKGWSPSVMATVPAYNVTYTAQWEINQYTVTFDANGGTCETEAATVEHGAALGELPVPTRSKAAFLGWFTESGVMVDELTTVTCAVTLYAHWLTEVANPVVTTDWGSLVFRTNSCVVSISCVTDGALIYYTDDGTTPKKNDNYLYAGPFTITDTTTIKAVAVIGDVQSEYVTVTITKKLLSLEEALDVEDGVSVAASATLPWRPILDADAKVGDATARSGAIGDRTNTWLSATVSGAGTMSFWCKVSCEHDDDNTFTWDRLMVYTNGVEVAEWRMDGETDWTRREVSFAGGENTVKWVYFKDRSVSEGEDCAWVDGVTWTLADVAVDVGGGKSVMVPMDWIDAHSNIVMAVGGDKSVAMKSTAANGRKVWECYVLGLDPEKTSDFKITSFPLKSDGTPDLSAITFEPAQNRWNLSGATPKLKGKATLDAEWQDVPPGGDPSFRFFTVEVQMP